DVDYPTNPLHRLLAGLPALLREKAGVPHYQVVVTTNYDDLLERAFAQAGEQFDVFTYRNVSEGEQGRFWHLAPGVTAAVPVESANDYKGLELDADGELLRPAILKIHGAINRTNEEEDSYVITEDHYIDYLTHSADISSLVPANLMQTLTTG